MTSISPDRNTLYDYDLSTLTNIRLNNRRAKQKLSNNILSERSNNTQNIRDTVYGSTRKLNQDDSIDIRLFRDSLSPSPYKQHAKYNQKFKPADDLHNYDIDSSYLEKENLRYLDKDFYSRGSKLNELKREKFLDNINSATKYTKSPNRQNLIDEDLNDVKPLRETIRTNNIGFRPRDKKFESYNLKRVASNNNNNSSEKFKSHPKLNDLDYDKEQLDNYDKRFEYLINKYDLDDDLNGKLKHKESDQFRNTIDELEDKLVHYKSIIKEIRDKSQITSSQNKLLEQKIEDLDKYIEFLETNFDQLYHKSNILKSEKEELQKFNEELISNNENYKRLLKRQVQIKGDDSIVTHNQDPDSTTYEFINFKPKDRS